MSMLLAAEQLVHTSQNNTSQNNTSQNSASQSTPTASDNACNTSPETTEHSHTDSYFSQLAKKITLPVIKTLNRCLGQWQTSDLQAPPDSTHLWELAETGASTLNAMATAEMNPAALWDNTLAQLTESQLSELTNLLSAIGSDNAPSATTAALLQTLPAPLQHTLLKHKEALANHWLFHAGQLCLNCLNPKRQLQLLKHIPNSVKITLITQLKNGLFQSSRLTPLLGNAPTQTPPAELTPAAPIQPAPLTQVEIEQFSEELWSVAADFLDAARTEKPDPAQALAAHQQTIPVSRAEQVSRLREAIKKHLPLFERVIAQPNLTEVIDQLCAAGNLPESLGNLLKNNVLKHDIFSNAVNDIDGQATQPSTQPFTQHSPQHSSQQPPHIDSARRIFANLSPILAPEDKHALIDTIPEADCQQLIGDLNHVLTNIDPYHELPFYREFSDSLSASIKVKPVRIVAEKLTKHYFQALSNYPEFQREISIAILRLGPKASMGKRIGAIAQAAGIGFQKGMQLFSNDIRDPEIREALEAMKQDVTPMPHQKVANIIQTELDILNSDSAAKFHYALADAADLGNVLKSATVGQVHPALLRITDLSLPLEDPARTRTLKVALKVKRDGLTERCEQEESGLRIALDKALATSQIANGASENTHNTTESADFAEAVKATIAELFEQIKHEIDFKGTEFENAKLAKVLYQAESGNVQLKSAACLAATDNLIIQEWAPGKRIDSLWASMCERAETEDNYSERLRFTSDVATALRLEMSTWIAAFISGDPQAGLYLDGDRHDANGHYDPVSQTYTLLDFGAGQALTSKQARTMNKLTAAISTGSATATLHYLLKLMPPDAKARLSTTDKLALKAQIKTHLTQPDDITRLNDMQSHLMDAGIWPEKLSLDTFVQQLDALDLREALLHGRAESNCPRPDKRLSNILTKRPATLRTDRMIQALRACGVKGQAAEGAFSDDERTMIAKAVNNEFRVMFTGVSLSQRSTHQLTDDYHELFLVKTLARLAECFVEAGLPAPGLVLQLNRGAKMISDKIEVNNRRILSLQEESQHRLQSQRDKRSLRKLRETDVGNVFMSALRPNALQFLGYRMRSRFRLR